MRYSTFFKFIAVVLCAASLLCMVGSAAGLVFLTELSGKPIYEHYKAELVSQSTGYAMEIGQVYASKELGGAPANLVNQYWGNDWQTRYFDWSRVGYTLYDPEGNVVQEQVIPSERVAAYVFEDIPVTGQYMNVVSTTPREEDEELYADDSMHSGIIYTEDDYTAYDAIPDQGIAVTAMQVTYADPQGNVLGSEGVSGAGMIGTLTHDEQGNALFRSSEPMSMDIPEGSLIVAVAFQDGQNDMLFEADCPSGAGRIEYDRNGCLIFRGMMPGTEIPVETAPSEQIQGTTAPTEEPKSLDGQVAFALQQTPVYSMPNANSAQLRMLEPGAEILILSQETFTDGGAAMQWGMLEDGWIKLEDVLVSHEEKSVPVPEIETKPAEQTLPEETIAATEPAPQKVQELPESTAVTEPEAEETLPRTATHTGYYYDDQQQREMVAEYELLPIPAGYTMEVRLATGALRNELVWTLLRLAEIFRDVLVKTLGISIVVFALCMVHLCCSAGRTRRDNEVRAGGLNRLPLDLYLAAGAMAEAGFVVLSVEGSEYFARNDDRLAVMFCCAMAYLACLVLVGFFFACVAQAKTPGGYWWRNTLCGRCLGLIFRIIRWIAICCRKMLRQWSMGRTERKSRLRRFAAALWDTVKRLVCWVGMLLRRCVGWLAGKLGKFFGMLPITWQFLVTGFILVLMLYVMMRTYKVGYILLGFGIFFAVILYAASAFAILLESAQKMSKGDLDTKVDDRMLVGGFRNFAAELNNLADVVVVSAKKQLKSERMKTELITNVSHDIKTPLTSIINYVDLLQKPHTEQQQEQYLEVLERQSHRLKKLVDDLMEMSKASSGNLPVEIRQMDAAETVNQVLGEFADKLDRAQLIPVFRHPEQQINMLADGRLVWRVMSNLLGNAVKYALPGTRIYLDLMEVDGKVVMSMKNISREELNVSADELLERFVRGDASRNTEGSGLGLNIAKSLMELQKGQLRIFVDGDLFKVTLIFPAA